jgi:hypothetical protein
MSDDHECSEALGIRSTLGADSKVWTDEGVECEFFDDGIAPLAWPSV